MLIVNKNKSILVDEYTTPCPISVQVDAKLDFVSELMQRYGIRHIPVGDGQRVVGIISDRDLKVVANFDDMKKISAQDIMSVEPYTVSSETPLEEVVMDMSRYKIGSALVIDKEDQSIGIFTSTDALNALIEILRSQVSSG